MVWTVKTRCFGGQFLVILVVMRFPLVLVAACGRIGFDPGSDSTDLIVNTTDDSLTPPAGKLSLREALAIVTPGETIRFDPTVFPVGGDATIALDTGLTVPAGAIVDGTDATVTITEAGPDLTLLDVAGDNVTLRALTLTSGAVGVHAGAVSNLLADHVTVNSTGAEGWLFEGTTGSTIQNGKVDGAGPIAIHLTNGKDVTVAGMFLALSTKAGVVYGIRVEGGSAIHVHDNTVDPGTAWMISFDSVSGSEIIGNIVQGGDSGIALTGVTSDTMVFRNVVMTPVEDSVFIDSTVVNTTVLNNTFYMAPDITDSGTGTMAMNNLVTPDPTLFVAPSQYDFHLIAGATAIDAAMDLGQDMLPDQPARFLGNGPDMGAVESF
jgi:hypothetical protein